MPASPRAGGAARCSASCHASKGLEVSLCTPLEVAVDAKSLPAAYSSGAAAGWEEDEERARPATFSAGAAAAGAAETDCVLLLRVVAAAVPPSFRGPLAP